MARRSPDAAILLITGSPAARMFDGLPPHVDVLKIPTIVKTGSSRLRPPHLPIPLEQMTSMRSRLIRDAVLSFAPGLYVALNLEKVVEVHRARSQREQGRDVPLEENPPVLHRGRRQRPKELFPREPQPLDHGELRLELPVQHDSLL